METLSQVCGGDVVAGYSSATPTFSHYSAQQTAPADSLAPGWLNINAEKLFTSSSQRISKAYRFPTKEQNDTLSSLYFSSHTCHTWNLTLTPTHTQETCFLSGTERFTTQDTVPSNLSWRQTQSSGATFNGCWIEKQLKPEWLISVFVFQCLIKDTN